MKRLFILALGFCLFGLISCEDKKDATTSTTETKSMDHEMSAADKAKIDAFNIVSDAFGTGDVSKIDSVVSEDFIEDHGDVRDIKGRDSLKAMIVMMHAKMKDAKTEIIDHAVSGDYVYGRMRYKGTSDGSMGMPAGPYDMSAIELVKYNSDNKIIEHWAFMEMREMMKMMPAPPAAK